MLKIYNEGFAPVLSQNEKEVFANLDIQVPLYPNTDNPDNPFTYYSVSSQSLVVMPAQSLKFLDDLSTAYAWLYVNGYSLETVTDYIAYLKYHDHPNGVPAPLTAMQIPENALEDPAVDELALRFFNSARAFILAHELGHIYYNHQGNQQVSALQSQQIEIEVDRYAMSLMTRTATIPMGSYLYFLMATHWELNLTDFSTYTEWRDYLSNESTHPLSTKRMIALGQEMERAAPEFAKIGINELQTIQWIASEMQALAHILDDPDIQATIRFKGLSTELAYLGPRHPNALPCDYISVEQSTDLFNGKYSGQMIQLVLGERQNPLPVCMILSRNGNRVSGIFSSGLGEGNLIGQVVDNRLIFDWRLADSFGKGIFETNSNDILVGTWGYGESRDSGGEWQLKQ